MVTMDYERAVLVVNVSIEPLEALRTGIGKFEHLALHRTPPFEHALDMLLFEDRISDWLVNEMAAETQRYSLSAQAALELIDRRTDSFFIELEQFYRSKFEERLINHCSALPGKITPADYGIIPPAQP